MSTTTTTTSTTVDRFLAAVAAGRAGGLAALYAPHAVLDATVPNWRFQVRGAAAIASQYARWFTHPGRFEELDRAAFAGGEVVSYLLTWEEHGVPHAAHHCHVLAIDATGYITSEKVWSGGRWDAALLAEMGAAGHAG